MKTESSLFKSFLFALAGLFIVSCTAESLKESLGVKPKPATDMVSIEDAQDELQKILDDIEVQSTRAGMSVPHKEIGSKFSVGTPKTRATDDDTPYYHVFNFKDNKGYAIMSGSKLAPSLIALTDSGSYSTTAIESNPGLKLFMESYKENYEKLLVDTFDSTQLKYYEYSDYENVVYNYRGNCQVKWGQSSPYNMYCPVINDTVAPTCCVATAVAQLLSIYKYPYRYNGYGFTWYYMTQYPRAYYCTTEAQQQIARLMYEIGKSSDLNVTYGTKESSAYSSNIPRTLTHIGFSNGGTCTNYNSTTVKQELLNGYNVLLSGVDLELGGHQWLCHGIMQRKRTLYVYDYYHNLLSSSQESHWYLLCNWGWNGNDDGYYLEGVFNTDAGPKFSDETESSSAKAITRTGYYRYNLTMVTGIRR